MFEKVNPSHPDKLCDRIAGALVDLAYKQEHDPRIAVEVMLGHGLCFIEAETSVHLNPQAVYDAVYRITGNSTIDIYYGEIAQDEHLAENQKNGFRCGDNGIFKGVPATTDQILLTDFAKDMYREYPTDGKFVYDSDANRMIWCQSNANTAALKKRFPNIEVNPLGDWTGGPDVDTGAVNRKLGSDMGDSVTGGGLHGKDLSKADVSVNIYAWLKAQSTGKPVTLSCAIGDDTVDGVPYTRIVEIARQFIQSRGGFEKFAEWGLLD